MNKRSRNEIAIYSLSYIVGLQLDMVRHIPSNCILSFDNYMHCNSLSSMKRIVDDKRKMLKLYEKR